MANEVQPLTCLEAQPLVRAAARGHLDIAEKARVDAHVANCPACQTLAEKESALDRLLEDRLPQYAAPLALKRRLQARLPAPHLSPRRPLWPLFATLALGAAAAVALFVSVGRGPREAPTLIAEAVADHLRVTFREHPVDIESGGPHQVKPWFTGRLDFALPAVFGGNDEFKLEGGSVGYFRDRQAAVLVYKRQLHTISLLVFRAEGLAFPAGTERLSTGGQDGVVTAAVARERGFDVVTWQKGALGYALVSDLNAHDLVRLATTIATATND